MRDSGKQLSINQPGVLGRVANCDANNPTWLHSIAVTNSANGQSQEQVALRCLFLTALFAVQAPFSSHLQSSGES